MSDIENSLQTAEQYCESNKLRFTDPRRRVLEILLSDQKPMGAYDVLEQLGQFIDNPKPPTAYRAIDFWREHGFLHKVESLNAYVICCEEHTHNDTHFLVCDDCNNVEELHTHNSKNMKTQNGFVSKRTFTETHGICGECVQENLG
jgi:Fur family zinc uptake transcriptional regulator